MLQSFLTFFEFTEFNESSAPFRENPSEPELLSCTCIFCYHSKILVMADKRP